MGLRLGSGEVSEIILSIFALCVLEISKIHVTDVKSEPSSLYKAVTSYRGLNPPHEEHGPLVKPLCQASD